MPPKFELFRLPYLPFAQIINYFLLDELIKLSLISKKAYKLIKFARKKLPSDKTRVGFGRLSVGVYTTDHRNLIGVMEKSELKEDDRIEGSVEINGSIVPTVNDLYWPLMTVWDDRLTGLLSVMEYVVELFDTTVGRLGVWANEKYLKCLRTIVDSISTRQQSVDHCHIEGDGINDEELTYFFERKFSKSVFLGLKTSDQFAYNEPFHWENIRIMDGDWVKLHNILGENIRNMEISESKLTNKDVNTFVKHWLNGGTANLKILKIETLRSSLDELLEGLEAEEVHEGTVYTVKRIDGTIGTVFIRRPGMQTDRISFCVAT